MCRYMPRILKCPLWSAGARTAYLLPVRFVDLKPPRLLLQVFCANVALND